MFSPGFFWSSGWGGGGGGGGGAGIRASKEVGEMLGINNLLLLFTFCVHSSPLGKEEKQERNLRVRKKNKTENEKERGREKEEEIRRIK